MAYINIIPLEKLYRIPSQESDPEERASIYSRDPLLHEPPSGRGRKFTLDAALLQEALRAYAAPGDSTLVAQVFGSQTRQQNISLRHLANILYERASLNRGRIEDLDRRLTDCQDRLSVSKMLFPLDGGKSQQNLERLLLDLEKQRHEEELAFWKDSAEIRQQLFENAAVYNALKRRAGMFYGMEAGHG